MIKNSKKLQKKIILLYFLFLLNYDIVICQINITFIVKKQFLVENTKLIFKKLSLPHIFTPNKKNYKNNFFYLKNP